MVDAFTLRQSQHVIFQERRAQRSWWLMFLGLLGASGLIGLMMVRGGPSWSVIAWLIYAAGIVAIFYQPRYSVYLILGLTMFADRSLIYWYPFVKNFSSAESLMYLSGAAIISPIETYLVFALISWLGRMAMERRIRIHTGLLVWPSLLFITLITCALGYGLARRGNINIALWEARSIYYLPIMLLLTCNLIRTRAHVSQLLWTLAIALFLKGIAGTLFVANVLQWDIGSVERIAEHSMSIHFNAFFVLIIVSWLYHDSTAKRLLLPLMSPVVLLSFFANHRRAGFLTLGIAVALIFLLLYRENRRLFWAVAPTGSLLFLAYLAIFWNNSGSIGVIARAVRSVVGQPTARDAASNVYRDIENVNIMFTIKAVPLFGVGFGQKFFIIAPLPDISFFVWWEYITHNSIMWIWMKAGVGGFFSLLTLVGMSMIAGGRAVWNMPRGPLRGAALVATLYVLMHFIYAFVDMSWDINSMVLVGTMMGLINCLDLVAAAPIIHPAKRWPWQPDPEALQESDPAPARRQPARRPVRLAPGLTRTSRAAR